MQTEIMYERENKNYIFTYLYMMYGFFFSDTITKEVIYIVIVREYGSSILPFRATTDVPPRRKTCLCASCQRSVLLTQ